MIAKPRKGVFPASLPPTGHHHPIRDIPFKPGEIFLHVKHGDGVSANTIQNWVVNDLWKAAGLQTATKGSKSFVIALKGQPPSLTPSVNNNNIFSLPGGSYIKVVVKGLQEDPKDNPQTVTDKGDTLNNLIETIDKFNIETNTKTGKNYSNNDITLGTVSHNWLFSVAGHIAGHPSPGGWPVSVPVAAFSAGQHEFQLGAIDAVINKHLKADPPIPVDVVIFDTAPHRDVSIVVEAQTSSDEAAEKVKQEKEIAVTQAVNTHTALKAIFNAFHTLSPTGTAQSTLEAQFPEDQIIYADELEPTVDLPPTPSENEDEHYTTKDYYDMSDHGTFIAGIIHSIAPHANIYLVQVMNDYGMGTLENIIRGVVALIQGEKVPGKKALPQPQKGRALVVNFSLGMSLPPADEKGVIVLSNSYFPVEHEEHVNDGAGHEGEEHPEVTEGEEHPAITEGDGHAEHSTDGASAPSVSTIEMLLEAALSPIKATFADLQQAIDLLGDNVVVVAAAGNDGEPGKEPPPPLYPAALKNVIGVGALDEGTTRAWYSNLTNNHTDNHKYRNLVVTGGKMETRYVATANPDRPLRAWNQSHDTTGLLGVYVGKFPQWDPNPGETDVAMGASSLGWARWSGTSFATAIMSGIFARAAQHGCTISIKTHGTNHFYEMLEAANLPMTARGEMILSVPQGLPPAIPWWKRLWQWFINLLKKLGIIK